MWLASVFCRWGWGAPVGGLVHTHPRETPFGAQRSWAGLHVSATQSCSRTHPGFFSVSWKLPMFGICRAKQQNLEERQADVEYELRCLLNKPGVCSSLSIKMKKANILINPFLILSQRKTGPRRTKAGSRSSWLSWWPSLNRGTKL